MSGLVNGIGKVFQTFSSGVTKIGNAIAGVGATAATSAIATKGTIAGGLGVKAAGGGVLNNILNGASNMVKNSLSFTGGGGMATATANAANGFQRSGMGSSFLDKAKDFLGSDAGAGLIGGIGEGLMRKAETDALIEEKQKDRDADLAKERRLQESYNVPASALGPDTPFVDNPSRPTPDQRFGRGFHWEYDPATQKNVKVFD